MSIRTAATAAASLAFGLVITVRAQAPAQAPVQTSIHATALPADNEFYALRDPAAAGDAQAQFELGNHYIDGRGVTQDYGQALTWYRKSADQGYAPALNQLGYMHQHKFGFGITSAPFTTTDWPQTRAMRRPSTTWEPCTRMAWE